MAPVARWGVIRHHSLLGGRYAMSERHSTNQANSADVEQPDQWATLLPSIPGFPLRTAVLVTVVILVATQPALAQTNPVCTDESGTLQDMIEGFVQITTALGLMGLLVVWQADLLMEMFTLSREQKRSIKQHKRGAMRSAATLVVLGPLFTVAGSAMDLPLAECVDLVPF